MKKILVLLATILLLICASRIFDKVIDVEREKHVIYKTWYSDEKENADTLSLEWLVSGVYGRLWLPFIYDDSEKGDYIEVMDFDDIGILPFDMLLCDTRKEDFRRTIIDVLRRYYCLEPYEHTRKVCLEYMYDERFPDDKYVMMQRRAYERWHNGIFNTDMGKIKYYTELDRLRLHLCVSGDTIGLDKLRQHYNCIGHPTRIIPYYMLLIDRYGREEYRKALHDSLVSAERVAAGCRELAKRYE